MVVVGFGGWGSVGLGWVFACPPAGAACRAHEEGLESCTGRRPGQVDAGISCCASCVPRGGSLGQGQLVARASRADLVGQGEGAGGG